MGNVTLRWFRTARALVGRGSAIELSHNLFSLQSIKLRPVGYLGDCAQATFADAIIVFTGCNTGGLHEFLSLVVIAG
ncbi:hypothetical protein VVYB158_13805 [Vibrio vulnificus CladeA-yb158]|uniref:Uncharacterized protein n=1 Tax=Vibrio vulnificus (strain CMCP6) TaxID=216895 RepID=A0A3Q0KY28_VIBVU|nr:Hypothetical protein VV2_0451 [Vibrio vulnificus CMCP6]ASC59448.1 hypothetical protein FORC37_3754 [Vibrio vulnificus]KLI66661.1 hypothetical protein VVYB158_13805 [Vibrio vulnificus CladeA-yb158]